MSKAYFSYELTDQLLPQLGNEIVFILHSIQCNSAIAARPRRISASDIIAQWRNSNLGYTSRPKRNAKRGKKGLYEEIRIHESTSTNDSAFHSELGSFSKARTPIEEIRFYGHTTWKCIMVFTQKSLNRSELGFNRRDCPKSIVTRNAEFTLAIA